MSTNNTQVGGSHYSSSYQHWDFVSDLGLSYLIGCVTKYVTRYTRKNGVQDLRKAIHYAEKQLEVIDRSKVDNGLFYSLTLPDQLSAYSEEFRTEKVSDFLNANFPTAQSNEQESLAALIFSTLCLPYIENIDNDEDFEVAMVEALESSIPKIQSLIALIEEEASGESNSSYTNQG